jgi:hypothetical protein
MHPESVVKLLSAKSLSPHAAEKLSRQRDSTQKLRAMVLADVIAEWVMDQGKFNQLMLQLSHMHRGLQPFDLSAIPSDGMQLVIRLALAMGMRLQVVDATAFLKRVETDWDPTLEEYLDHLINELIPK